MLSPSLPARLVYYTSLKAEAARHAGYGHVSTANKGPRQLAEQLQLSVPAKADGRHVLEPCVTDDVPHCLTALTTLVLTL